MGERIPGYDQNQMMAKWREFVKSKLGATSYKTKDGKTVYTKDKKFYVLDEWHGHLEVLDPPDAKGKANHAATLDLVCVWEPVKPGEKVAKWLRTEFGKLQSPKEKHEFVLIKK